MLKGWIMRDEHNGLAQKPTPGPGSGPGQPRPHPFFRPGIAVVIVLLLLGLLSLYLPGFIARYLITSELDDLGIQYEGVDTLEINPWSQELWFGPAHFGVDPSDPGQVGELGLTIRYNPLLDRRIYVDRLLIRGLDLIVTHSKEDKAYFLNGIPLNRFITLPDQPGQPVDEDSIWGAGIDNLELRDSRLIFQESGQGDLELEVEQLALTEFRTWEPERPGRFELKARVNDIQLNWSGEARPFADNITLDIDSRTEQAEVPKILRFTGPWGRGLDRGAGIYTADLKYQMTIFDSGRLEGRVAGTIDITGADYASTGVFALTMEKAKLDVDVDYTLSESDEFTLKGEIATELGQHSATTPKTSYAVDASRIAIDELDIAYAKDKILRIAMQPDIDLEKAAFSGPIDFSIEAVLDLLVLLQSLSDPGAVSTKDTGLSDFADTSVVLPALDMKVGRLQSKGESFLLQSTDGQLELGLKFNSDLSGIQLSPGEGHEQNQLLKIERLQSRLEQLTVKSGQGRLTVDMAGGNSLTGIRGEGPRGELKADQFETKVGKLGLQVQPDAVSLQLADASETSSGLSAVAYAGEGFPEVQFSVDAASAMLDQASLDAHGGKLRWQGAGDATIESLTADFAKGKDSAVTFGNAEVRALQLNERTQLSADAMTIDGLTLFVKRSLLEALLKWGNKGTEKTGSPEDALAETAGAAPEQEPELQGADVRQAQTLLTELGYEPGPADGQMGHRTVAAIKAFQRREGLTADGRLTENLLTALQTRTTQPRVEDGEPSGMRVRLGQLALTGNSTIRFQDDIVKPPVTIDAAIKEAQIQNLDTRKTDQRTEVRILVDVNEFTEMELSGWARGVNANADLDLNAKMENLELSTYSPYFLTLAGVHLESGQLDTAAGAKAENGSLQGKIRIGADDITFRPLSKKEAEQLTETMGMPLETAVGLLQDNKGHIGLELPVSGTLNQPDVDISSAVNKAIGGALAKVFPPTMIASMLSNAEKGTGPAFEPIEFLPGSAELDEAGKRYADDLAKLLAEHPKLSLKVCSRLTVQDLDKLMTSETTAPTDTDNKTQATPTEAQPESLSAETAQALTELAVERQRIVRRYLIREKGADTKRVGECRSTLEATDQGTPRVEISLKR